MTKQILLSLLTRIDAILKNNRRLDVQLKPRFRLMVATLLLTCLPLLAMAQLVPLKTFQVSLFAQTPEKSEKAVDKTAKKQGMQKAKAEKMDKKAYKDDAAIKVADPSLLEKSEENKIFSGPQPGEKLLPLTVNGIGGKIDGTTFDITTKADGKPLVLFLQDTNAVGVKGLVNVSRLLLKIDAFQKRHSEATGAGLQIGVVFLADSLETLPDWAHHMLNKEIPKEILTGISPDGREGPGSYGLNRNVAQTVLVAKDGKVLHNFAFTQPMLYADPYLLGAVADAVGADAPALEKWLNEKPAEDARAAAAKRRNENRYRPENVEVKDPAAFKKVQGATLFSGPQPGEKLPPLKAKAINGETQGKTSDVIAKADGQLLVLFLQDESGLGLRGLLGISRLLAQIREKSEQTMHINAVFLGDAPDTVENQVRRLIPHIPKGVLLTVSQDGREGPGSYGLNRNVAQTVIIAKDGKVLHNFAFTQAMLRPDPYLLGAVGDAIGVQPATLEKWLNVRDLTLTLKNPIEGEKVGKMLLNGDVVPFDELSTRLLNLPEKQKAMLTLQAGREVSHEQIVKVMDIAKEAGIDKIEFSIGPAEALGKRLREMVEKGEITGEEARERYEKAFPRGKED